MRAVSCADGELSVVELPDPEPARGQLLLRVVRCGICGSDLHAKDHCDELADVMAEVAYDDFMRATTPVVMGHEFCGEVLESRAGGRGRAFREGQLVVSFPLLRVDGAVRLTGLSPLAPGGYAERVLAEASMSFAVPNGLAPEVAALTEPMAVAHHAVRRGEVSTGDVAVVLGCGPVGLAVVCQLVARGVRTILASDPSAARRALATACGAHVVVDPSADSPDPTVWDAVASTRAGRAHLRTAPELLGLAVGSMDKLRRLPGWSHVYRAVDALGVADPKRPVVFECVGVPGMLDGVLAGAPLATRVVVVGVCMGADRLRPSMAINKEIELRFVLGYTPLEFRDTLHQLAEGEVDASPLITGTVGLDGVAGAFADLRDPETHAKILIDPSLR